MNGLRLDAIYTVLTFFFVISLIFCPDITIREGIPTFQAIDFLLPFLFVIVILKRKQFQWNNYYWILLGLSGYIFLTMVLNQQLREVSSYFEIFKILKFALIIVFFSLIQFNFNVDAVLKIIFTGLLIINAFHFFDVFSINKWIGNYYSGGLNITYFGKNSLGQAAGKRMVGLMANPNTNAILFSFFTIYFLPLKFDKRKIVWFFLALTLTFMCQSRTMLISLIAIFMVILALKLSDWKVQDWLLVLFVCLLAYFLAWSFSSSFFKYPIYGNSLFNGVAYESQSAMGRIETWKFLGNMILDKPIIGYGPNKYFFYDHHIYSENEYILYTWRYGFIGLIIYGSLFFVLLRKCYRNLKQSLSKYLILVIVLFTTTALTNNPFTERTLSLIFAMIIGVYFSLNVVNPSPSTNE